MRPALQFAAIAALLCATCAARGAAAPVGADATAGSVCETAVAETLRGLRGKGAQEVQFGGAGRPVLPPPAGDNNTTLAGKGQYRGAAGPAKPFNYTCTFDAQTGKASGVVLREADSAAPVAQRPWEPDLTNLSPEACEAAAAAALTEQYPAFGRIRFDADSRRLEAAPDARTSLQGRGSLERAAGMNPAPFTYRCLFEAGSGKLVGVQTRD